MVSSIASGLNLPCGSKPQPSIAVGLFSLAQAFTVGTT